MGDDYDDDTDYQRHSNVNNGNFENEVVSSADEQQHGQDEDEDDNHGQRRLLQRNVDYDDEEDDCLEIRLQIIIIIIINNMMRMRMSNRMIINNKMIIHSHKRINMFLMMDRMNKMMMTVMMDMIMDSNSNNMTIRNRLSHRNIIRNNSKAHIIQCLKNIKVAIVMCEVFSVKFLVNLNWNNVY